MDQVPNITNKENENYYKGKWVTGHGEETGTDQDASSLLEAFIVLEDAK